MKGELLFEMSALRKEIARSRLKAAENLTVEGGRNVPVYAEPFNERGEYDDQMAIGAAEIQLVDDRVLGTVIMEPHLEEFYAANPKFRPKFVVVSNFGYNGDVVDSIIIRMLRTKT